MIRRRYASRGVWAVACALGWAAAGAAGAQGQAAAAPLPRVFRLDASHSDVQFSIGFLYGTRVRGRFDALRGTLRYDEREPERSTLTFVIGVESINTGSRHRDEHLRSADFLDAAAHPFMVFQSRRVERTAEGYALVGPLTMRGVTREVRIPFRVAHPPVATPQGHRVLGFDGALQLRREDFGVLGGDRFNPWFDRIRSAAMADSVDVELAVEWWDTDFDREQNAGLAAALARIEQEGVAAVVARIRALKAERGDAFAAAEWDVAQIARALLARGRTADALEIFELGAELFPRSAAAHANLGHGHEAAGDPAAARRSYERALALDAHETLALEGMRLLLK